MELDRQMLRAIPLVAGLVSVGHTALYPYLRMGTAVSDEARTIQMAASELTIATERSQALFGARQNLLSELRAIAEDCSTDDWDGSGGVAVNTEALQKAEDLIRTLPEGIPLPEVAPEPDGSLSMDWIRDPYRLYSLSIGPLNRLAYAWLDGTDKGHGVVGFDGISVPSRVISDIQRIMVDDDAAVRSA
jgi:hypothetical protein